MKSNIFCTMVFILIGNIVTAQEDQINPLKKNSDYWSLSYSAGLVGNINHNTDDIGFTYNLDASYTPAKNIGIFLNFSVSDIPHQTKYIVTSGWSEYYTPGDSKYLQFTFGPRIYSNKKTSFIDLGMGYYNINHQTVFGMNLGLGGKIRLSDNYALMLSGRINYADLFNNQYSYFGLTGGVEINNGKKTSKTEKNKKFSLTALLGTYGNSFYHFGRNSFSGEFSYDLSNRTSLIMNYLYSKLQEDYSANYSENKYENNIAGGARIYLTESNVRLFFEGLTGLYKSEKISQDYVYNPYSIDIKKNHFGFTFGAGTEVKLIESLSGIFKFDQVLQISGKTYSGFFGGLKYNM